MKKNNKKIFIGFRLEEKLSTELVKHCKRLRINKSIVVRNAIGFYLDYLATKINKSEQRVNK